MARVEPANDVLKVVLSESTLIAMPRARRPVASLRLKPRCALELQCQPLGDFCRTFPIDGEGVNQMNIKIKKRYEIGEIADALVDVAEGWSESGTDLFASFGLDPEEAMKVIERVPVGLMRQHQAMAIGMLIGIRVAEGAMEVED